MPTEHARNNRSTATAPLVSGGFKRVSRKRPCRVCNRGYFCGYASDERTSICMWVSDGPTYRGPSRNGGNIHVHTDIPVTPAIQRSPQPETPSIPLAPLEIRDAVFQELIRISPATNYRAELISGPHGLLARGLSGRQIRNYGALPPTSKERATLAAALRSFVLKSFPTYSKLYSGAGVVGIPGFWQELSGIVHVWKRIDYNMPILVIPYKDPEGLIQACQIRLHAEDIPDDGKKYRWLASPLERLGTSSGTPIHFTFKPKDLPPGGGIIYTEGGLKADAFVRFERAAHLIATSGVSCSHAEMIEAGRPYNASIGFDADHKTNPAVCRQLARLIASRVRDAEKHQLSTTTDILVWQGPKGRPDDVPKGIDEAAKKNIRLSAISISEWKATLTGKPLNEVTQYWSEIGFTP